MTQIWALYRQSGSDRLEKQPTDLAAARQYTSYFGDTTLGGPLSKELSGTTCAISTFLALREGLITPTRCPGRYRSGPFSFFRLERRTLRLR
jgi:hypothetical protein